MKRKFYVCLLIASLVSATYVVTAELKTRGPTNDKVQLYIGNDPKPKSEGFVAYEIEKQRFVELPEWGPDTNKEPPPFAISDAVALAKTEIETKYHYKGERVMLNEVVLLKAANASKNVWYYVVSHQINMAKNPFYTELNDLEEIRVVVLMDGNVVEPSHIDMSQQIRIHGSNVRIDPGVITKEEE